MITPPIAAESVANTAPLVESNLPTLGRLARSTALVMILLSLAKVVSLVQKLIIVQRFGIGAEWDTFVAANQVPEQVFNLIAGGALGYAFIPVFSDVLTRVSANKATQDAIWKLAANVLNTVLAAAILISVVIFFAAPWLVANVVAPGFSAESAAQTVGLMRILLVSLVIFSVSGLTTSILQSYNRFFLPALAPILYDVGVLFGAAVLSRRFGVYGIAYGAVLGAAGHFLIQVPGLVASRARWWPTLTLRDPDLRRIVRLMIPRTIGIGLLNVNLLVAINLASQLGTGKPSTYSWAWALMQLPETLIGTAMGIIIFPTLSVLSSASDLSGKRSALSGAWRFILLGTIPVAALMVLVGRQALTLLQGGAFDVAGADAIYGTLIFFAPGLIIQSSIEVVARCFYADKDTVTPLYIAFLSAAINIGIALLVFRVWDVPGLAVANTVATAVELLALSLILRRRWHGLDDAALWQMALKTAIATVAMSVVILGALALIGDRGTTTLSHLVILVGVLAVGGLTFVAVALALRMRELGDFIRAVRERRKPTV